MAFLGCSFFLYAFGIQRTRAMKSQSHTVAKGLKGLAHNVFFSSNVILMTHKEQWLIARQSTIFIKNATRLLSRRRGNHRMTFC